MRCRGVRMLAQKCRSFSSKWRETVRILDGVTDSEQNIDHVHTPRLRIFLGIRRFGRTTPKVVGNPQMALTLFGKTKMRDIF